MELITVRNWKELQIAIEMSKEDLEMYGYEWTNNELTAITLRELNRVAST